MEDTRSEHHSSEQPQAQIHWELTSRGGPWFCSHRCLPLSVSVFLLPLHLAEAVKTTETGESELGHALGWAGKCSPDVCRERQGRRVGEMQRERERGKLGLSFPEASGLPEAAACPAME